ncbi:hypothetical protein [Larkinella terrae]|uniref:Uncharacterized protein n=1 Tax=Larkinella terrae TaxID=2025311 RepID=A0A7K0EIX9_9BACT|nr:hypothetical protein [Larkinella terrae]MRS61820.1 hypothetical protein [Larkinella terrae]
MLLIFSVIFPDSSEIRPLVFYSESIEIGFDVLNSHIKHGIVLLSAVLRDINGTETRLPIEAIDGEPVKEYIERLQIEWEKILKRRS